MVEDFNHAGVVVLYRLFPAYAGKNGLTAAGIAGKVVGRDDAERDEVIGFDCQPVQDKFVSGGQHAEAHKGTVVSAYVADEAETVDHPGAVEPAVEFVALQSVGACGDEESHLVVAHARGGKGFKEGREEDLIGRGPCFVINDNDDFFRLFRPEILSEGSVPRWGCKHPAGFFQGIFQNGERVEMYDMGCAAIVHVEGDCTVAITKVKMHNGGLSGHRVQKSCGFCPCPG